MEGSWYGLIAGIVVVTAGIMRWRDQRLAANADAPRELRERLGDDLARWLMTARRLATRIAAFGEKARTIAAREQQALLLDGAASMQTAHDASLSHEVGEVQSSRSEWLQQAEALGEEERATLTALGIGAARPSTAFDLPWLTDPELEAIDRAEELQALVEQCVDAEQSLGKIDGWLSGPDWVPRR